MNLEMQQSEGELIEQQAIKFAKEFSSLYKQEKEKRLELEKAHADLQRYAEELEQANSDLRDFAFIASHDLQEPLRKICMFSGLISDYSGDMSEKGRDYLGRLERSVLRMQKYIEDLLLFSKVTRKEPKYEVLDLKEVVNEVMEDLEFYQTTTGGKVVFEELGQVVSDRIYLRQLLQNLISNGLKFHKKDQPPRVEIIRRSRDDGAVEICVRDNGVGFDPKYAERIFKPFERLNGRSAFEGSGMGLTVCRKITHRMGGGISAESSPGKGAEFVFIIPEHSGQLNVPSE